MPHTPLKGEQHHAVDTNPLVTCDDCGETERWDTVRKSWSYSHGPDGSTYCVECAARRRRKTIRIVENHSLTDYTDKNQESE